jgi:hypothetical protein
VNRDLQQEYKAPGSRNRKMSRDKKRKNKKCKKNVSAKKKCDHTTKEKQEEKKLYKPR